MHASGFRALSAVPVAARVSLVARRSLHCTRSRLVPLSNDNDNGSSNPNPNPKSADDSVTEQDDESESQSNAQASGGRQRSLAPSSKIRQAKQRNVLALPPVKLRRSFYDHCVTILPQDGQPKLYPPLQRDLSFEKRSPPLVPMPQPGHEIMHAPGIVAYFEKATELLVASTIRQVQEVEQEGRLERKSALLSNLIRNNNLLLDTAWHYADALYPARKAEYIYKSRPFWWWHMYRDFDPRTNQFRGSRSIPHRIAEALDDSARFTVSLAQALPDFDRPTLKSIYQDIGRSFDMPVPQNFDPKISVRPITILSMSGYDGKSIAHSVAAHVACKLEADVVHLDAFDLAEHVGEYIGQDWAYNHGPLSMLGFRTAEINGKLAARPEKTEKSARSEDEDDDTESRVISLRSVSSSIEEELSKKPRSGEYDVFTKWERLKIDKILDHMIRYPQSKHAQDHSRPILIHLHDILELSLTLEGMHLVSRLRVLVDTAWQQGVKIAILGTSSCKQPSEEYQEALQEASIRDFVISRHVQPHLADKITSLKPSDDHVPYELQKGDMAWENCKNINRMIAAMDPTFTERTGLAPLNDEFFLLAEATHPATDLFHGSICPPPELHFLAKAVMHQASKAASSIVALNECFDMWPQFQKPAEHLLHEHLLAGEPSSKNIPRNDKESKVERAMQKLNDHEKRVALGHINTKDIRVTFADVHVPPDTISALKVLTSLALVRPDAFSYGVLATDKIPGCLLYGPPGTGKTMLAKAVAKESGANMLEITGASINDKWVGESEKLIRAVFSLAKRLEPCVVFIDEADSLFASRSMPTNRASHREHINQFLREWDGMRDTNAFIMIATNRPFDLDDAVLRRLPRKILVDLPMKDDRAAILRLLLRGETLEESVSIDSLAERTAFYSGSDLKNLCVAAAMTAVEEENVAAAQHTGPEPYQYPKKRILRQDHFDKALQQIPASISEDMQSLKQIRKFDEEFGNRRKKVKRSMGFGIIDDQKKDVKDARIRP